MIRMSRAGCKSLMLKVLAAHDKRHRNGALTTAKLAHGAGLMSSSNVVAMLKELEMDGLIFEVQIEPSYQCGYTVRAWAMEHWSNKPLPDRFITIGKVSVNWNTGEVVENVAI